MKPFIIRKQTISGCWHVYKVNMVDDLVTFTNIACCETFGDVLVLLNTDNTKEFKNLIKLFLNSMYGKRGNNGY